MDFVTLSESGIKLIPVASYKAALEAEVAKLTRIARQETDVNTRKYIVGRVSGLNLALSLLTH